MTELERARKHLGEVQCELAFFRQQRTAPLVLQMAGDAVLAALSWVWSEQQKESGSWPKLFVSMSNTHVSVAALKHVAARNTSNPRILEVELVP